MLPSRHTIMPFLSVLVALLTGCASVAVSGDAISDRTAFALSLDKSAFTISNRADDGVRSTYSVKTNAGKNYNCYVAGSISVVGRVVSDAVCNEVGGSVKPSSATPGNPVNNAASCNALLKAAGRC
jgi:hypothetical protein